MSEDLDGWLERYFAKSVTKVELTPEFRAQCKSAITYARSVVKQLDTESAGHR